MDDNGVLQTHQVLSAFVSCTPQGRLPGCEFRFDKPNAQCIDGREGMCLCVVCVSVRVSVHACKVTLQLMFLSLLLLGRLCGTCKSDLGVTLDLQSCQENCTPGIILFVIYCKLSVTLATHGCMMSYLLM